MRAASLQQMQLGISPAALIAGAVVLLALPSAVLAFSARFEPHADALAEAGKSSDFMPASVDPRLARQFSVSSLPTGQVFRFTPAGISTRANRSVTVAVRVDAETARAVSVRKPLGEVAVVTGLTPLRIAPTAYSLGVARGSQSFALPAEIRRIDMPDLAAFKPSAGPKDQPSRFSPRLTLDAREKAGRSPRTYEANPDQSVDLGGSYRLGKNLDVTAGVRYQQSRDRLVPLTDGKQDSQAVYVGTQFKF
ncbi:MAG: hypothetical protein ABIW31_01575 [Novosphingobium sp.]